MISMTGYGYSEETYEFIRISVEIKTVNNRFLDINLRNPYVLNSYDGKIRNKIRDQIKRGKIDVYINLHRLVNDYEIIPDVETAVLYYKTFNEIKDRLKKEDPSFNDNAKLSDIINAEGIISVKEKRDSEKIWEKVEMILEDSIGKLMHSKKLEGENTRKDLDHLINSIDTNLQEIKNHTGDFIKCFEEKIRNKMEELLKDSSINEERIMQEVSIMSTKTDVNEEIKRLESHIALFKDTMDKEEHSGRKLDFISQEILREINTIGSKSPNIEISNIIINMKTELEKIKEQIRNVE